MVGNKGGGGAVRNKGGVVGTSEGGEGVVQNEGERGWQEMGKRGGRQGERG